MIAGASSPAQVTAESRLLTYADLHERWQPVGKTKADQQRCLVRWARRWGLKPLAGGSGATARFRLINVIEAEARAAGERRPR